MKTYYLIDFENVNETGLAGFDNIGNDCKIIIFYTDRCKNINMDFLSSSARRNLFSFFKVPMSDQSLDMHLVSYLGYLIGKDQEEKKFIIVSKDTDYDKIITFWKEKQNADIKRQQNLKGTAEKVKTETKPKPELKEEEKTVIINNVKSLIGNLPEKDEVIEIVKKYINDERRKNSICNTLRAKLKNDRGLEIYNLIKKKL